MHKLRSGLLGALCAAAALGQPAYAGNAVADLLTEIIRVNTSNPPGSTGPLDELLAAKLKPLGFEITIVPTPEAGKSHLIARLKGDGSAKPVLLASHADVVGVEREKWTVDPFAGIVKDGYVYGRGAIDFKGGIAVFAEAVMRLARNKVPLKRDVIFLVEADEEGAQYNTSWLARLPLGRDGLRIRPERRRLDHEAPRRQGPLCQHLHRRQNRPCRWC